MEQDMNKRRGRGPGKKPAMAHVTLRLPHETLEFFNALAVPATRAMRRVLEEFAKKHSKPD